MNDKSAYPMPNGGGVDPPTDDGSIDNIKQYIDASAESADRARFVLLVMVTASVLALLAMWNSRPGNWTLKRLTVATNAQKFYDKDGKTILRDEQVLKQQVWPQIYSQQTYDSIPEQKGKEEYLKSSEEAFNSAKGLAAQPRFADLDHLKNYVSYLERMRTERIINVSVPFFGIVFDINDLGMLAGVSFFIILLLFRFSLLRELRNVRLVFKQAKTVEQLELCYNRLAMQQVLTSPPLLDFKPPEKKIWRAWAILRGQFWNYIPKILYLLPFLAHLIIFRNDWKTLKLVQTIYPGTSDSLWVSGIFLGLNMLLTGLCLFYGWKIDRTWRNHARFILENSDPAHALAESESGAGLLESAQEHSPAGEATEEKTPSKRSGGS